MTDWEPPAGLANKRAIARAALWFEQLWPAVWPALGVLGAFVAVALLGLPEFLPPWPRVLLFPLVLLTAAGAMWWSWRGVRRPGAEGVDRRLERASGLAHRPLAALQDRAAAATPEARAVWAVHRARLAAEVGRLRLFAPRPGLPGRDRRALRLLVLLAVAACLVVAGWDTPRRLLAAIAPGLPAGAPLPGTVVQAWLTPPAYTGLPPVFLHADGGTEGRTVVRTPTGSRLTVSVTGGDGAPSLAFGDERTAFTALDTTSWQADREIQASGALAVERGGLALAAWPVEVIADVPPRIAFTEPPGPAMTGGRPTLQTRLAWRAEDDYGVASVQSEIRLGARPEAAPVVVAAPVGGSPRQARGAFVRDLTAHPWAGLAVVVRVVARDAAGQSGASEDAALTLPERTFTNLAARALIAIRKQLSLAPQDRAPARQAVDAIAERPDLYEDAPGIFLNLRAVASLLARGRNQVAVDEAQERLWQIALALEEGTAERTARALEQARQALRDALEERRAQPDDPARQAELERRNEALREAIQRHLEALNEQARREGSELPFDPASPQMSPEALDRMAQDMEKSAREGRMDDAKRQMAELERLLEQLQNARPEHGEQREQRNAERRQQGRQQQDAVQDMVRREGDLLDSSRSRAEAQGQRTPPGQREVPQQGAQQAPQQAPQQAGPEGAREQEARRQRAMRRALGELMQRFGDLTGQIPAPLGEADSAMRDAGEALAAGRDPAAAAAAQRAIEALQKGGREMGQQLARQFGTGQQPGEGEEGQDEAGTEPGANGRGDNAFGNRDGQTTGPQPGEQQGQNQRRTTRRDPLGRPLQDGVSGSEEAGDVRVPDTMEEARTRALQEELRRRGAERTRPQPELDYIDRLLKPF